jgi:inhibitor of KinA
VIQPRVFPIFTAMAEHSLLVELGDSIDRVINDRVLALDANLAATPFEGFLEAVPAYACLLIRFDPIVTDHATAKRHVKGLIGKGLGAKTATQRQVLVCYDADIAPDLAEVATLAGWTTEAVIAAHLSARYEVFMYGFAPGYAYLAGVPLPIRLPRKPAAVRGVAAGSVLIAGPQCLVSTLTMPTGWWIIGGSPTRILTGQQDRPFLFDVGDSVRFKRIDRATFDAMARQ